MPSEGVQSIIDNIAIAKAEGERINSGDAAFKQVMKEYFNIDIPANVLHDQLADYVSSKLLLPGPSELITGNMEAGYFGSVPASEMGKFVGGSQDGKAVTGTTLAAQCGISAGTPQNDTITFHKFAYKREILYVPQKSIRYSLIWNDIAEASCVFGGKEVEIGKATYKVTLLRGLNKEKTSISNTSDSEWDKLWPLTGLSASEIGATDSGYGSWSWCQETVDGGSVEGYYRLRRGGSSLVGSTSRSAVYTDKSNGWRPALRFTL